MPIVEADLATRYSGGASNSNGNLSLGGVKSSNAFATNVLNALFDDVSGAEAAAGDVEYRGFYYHNGHGTLSWESPVYWIDSLTSSGSTEFDIAVAAEGVNVTMATIADESTAPATVSFTRPTSKGTGLALSTIPAGQHRGVWLRRTVTAGASPANDSGSVRAEGDTAA
jgi:hypothetical protein